jgi:hypothetical protein
MLYEYRTGQLDPERAAAVSEFVRTDAETKAALETLDRGLRYAQALSKISIPEDELKSLMSAETQIRAGLRHLKWSSWPDALRWSLSAFALSLSLGLVFWMMGLWQGDHPSEEGIEIARIESGSGVLSVSVDATEEESEQAPEVGPPPPSTGPAAEAPTPPAQLIQSPVVQSPVAAAEVQVRTGFVYRAFLGVANPEASAEKLRVALLGLGAKKAGQVDLGSVDEERRYFHFTVPSENESAVNQLIRGEGPVRMSKDPHPRMMPEGLVRYILWVEPSDSEG